MMVVMVVMIIRPQGIAVAARRRHGRLVITIVGAVLGVMRVARRRARMVVVVVVVAMVRRVVVRVAAAVVVAVREVVVATARAGASALVNLVAMCEAGVSAIGAQEGEEMVSQGTKRRRRLTNRTTLTQ
jgi:hypothetical protein